MPRSTFVEGLCPKLYEEWWDWDLVADARIGERYIFDDGSRSGEWGMGNEGTGDEGEGEGLGVEDVTVGAWKFSKNASKRGMKTVL